MPICTATISVSSACQTVRMLYGSMRQRFNNTATLIDWSKRRDDDIDRPLFVVPTPGAKKVSVMDTDWFNALIHAVDIKGKKGQIGRNNTLFTLALVCLQEGWSKDRTMDFLDEFNYRLNLVSSGSSLKKICY